jgi:hypothetical protein
MTLTSLALAELARQPVRRPTTKRGRRHDERTGRQDDGQVAGLPVRPVEDLLHPRLEPAVSYRQGAAVGIIAQVRDHHADIRGVPLVMSPASWVSGTSYVEPFGIVSAVDASRQAAKSRRSDAVPLHLPVPTTDALLVT